MDNADLNTHEFVCTACACLCDDIKGEFQGNHLSRIENACARGTALLYAGDNLKRRTVCSVKGRKATLEEAVEKSAQLLQDAKNPLIFGLDNSTLEAQTTGIRLAQTLGAVIDDTSSFCQGALIQAIFDGSIPTCSFSEVKNSANLLVFWGSNPHHSHPRHLSSFSYYPHVKSNETDFMPEVKLGCVEVRDTETSLMCYPVFKIKPGEDNEFIQNILASLRESADGPDSKPFVEMVEKSDFCVIFVGLGLTYSLDGDFQIFNEMVHLLKKSTRIAVIPMVGHFNMRGFNQLLYEETGYVNRISFAAGVSHGEEYSFLEQVRKQSADCIMIIGSDPFSNLPQSLMGNLRNVPIICLDPFTTLTTQRAEVVFSTAVSGLEAGGSAIRMDGETIFLTKPKSTDLPSDEAVLQMLFNKVR